jgi:hypothetical protein
MHNLCTVGCAVSIERRSFFDNLKDFHVATNTPTPAIAMLSHAPGGMSSTIGGAYGWAIFCNDKVAGPKLHK